MLHQLKVKIKTLAAEAQIIWRDEQTAFRTAREMRIRKRLAQGGLTDKQITRAFNRARAFGSNTPYNPGSIQRAGFDPIRIAENSDKPAEWAFRNLSETVPFDSWIGDHHIKAMDLKAHRRGPVRKEARSALLAYAFLRGKSYARTEASCRHYESAQGANQPHPYNPAYAFLRGTNQPHPYNPDWKEVERIARRFASEFKEPEFEAWVAAAMAFRMAWREREPARARRFVGPDMCRTPKKEEPKQ